ncbi:HAD family hydrolase [Streptomyces sp. NPDC054956]
MTTIRRAAFFDVDGTLTTATTLFRFLEYRLAADGHPPHVYRHERQRLRAMTAAGAARTETNRAHFACYAGEDAARVAALAEEWFAAELRAGDFLHEPAVTALRRHQDAGDRIVLVSGSFPAPLAPLARLLDADAVLCTEPEILAGRYTGKVALPMIGRAKADAARVWAAHHGVSLADSTAYGDHSSDLPILELTGRAGVIGGDEEMRHRARCHGWQQLPGTLPPAPLALPSLR